MLIITSTRSTQYTSDQMTLLWAIRVMQYLMQAGNNIIEEEEEVVMVLSLQHHLDVIFNKRSLKEL